MWQHKRCVEIGDEEEQVGNGEICKTEDPLKTEVKEKELDIIYAYYNRTDGEKKVNEEETCAGMRCNMTFMMRRRMNGIRGVRVMGENETISCDHRRATVCRPLI